MEKDFENWHRLKAKLQSHEKIQIFKESEIWWCSIGINLGCEEDGKNGKFSRPILIIKKFNKQMFWAVPLTTSVKENRHYYKINFQENIVCAMLSQLKIMDSKRLTTKMGKLPDSQLKEIKKELSNYLLY